MCRCILIWLVCFYLALSFAGDAIAASPRLARFVPGCVTRGKTVDVLLEGERMEDPLALHFYETGIKATRFKAAGDAVRVTLEVAPDCRIGEHVGHLQTRTGVTEYRPLQVIPLDTVEEVEGNDSPETAQLISLNRAYCGRMLEKDRDFYVLESEKPMILSVELLGMRLGNTVLDSVVTIRDESGKLMASSTGHPFSVNDPMLQVELKDPGRYYIEVRELLGAGNEQAHYVLCVGDYPRPLALYPPGGPTGRELEIECRGDLKGNYNHTIRTPPNVSRDHSYAPPRDGPPPPTPIPFRLSRHTNLLEVEPNNSLLASTRGDLKQAFCGTISESGDEDWFGFSAKGGESIDIEVYARRVRSSLDPSIAVYDAEGNLLASNDDGGKVTDHSDAEERGVDCFLKFQPPDNGNYYLRIRDILHTGLPTHVYRIECTSTKPWMLIRLPRVQDPNELYGQYRQQIFIARGNRFATLARARTRNFSGRLKLEFPQLPEGVSYETQNIPAGTTGFPVVFTAADDAPLGGGLYTVRGSHEDSKKQIEGGYYNYADLLRAKENLSLLKTKIVEKVPIVVTDAIPFKLEAAPPETPLVRSGIWKLKVRAMRDEGFEEPIRLTMPFLPPGIATSSGAVIESNQTEAEFTLKAHPKITPRDWKIYVQGVSGEENNWMWASTQIVPLHIQKGFAGLRLLPARAVAGEAGILTCEIDLIEPMPGEATVEVTGLPDNVTAKRVSLVSGKTQLQIPLTLDADARIGSHGGLRAILRVPVGDQFVVSEFGPTTLEITAADAASKAEEKVAAKTDVAPAGSLSRLEQLRLDAKNRAANRAEVSP